MDDLTMEATYINTKKAYFKEIFNKDADDHLELFLTYISDITNRKLVGELDALTKEIKNRFSEVSSNTTNFI